MEMITIPPGIAFGALFVALALGFLVGAMLFGRTADVVLDDWVRSPIESNAREMYDPGYRDDEPDEHAADSRPRAAVYLAPVRPPRRA